MTFCVLSFPTERGKFDELQYTDAPTSHVWQPLPHVAGDGSIKTLTKSAPGVGPRYFRLLEH